MARDCGQVAGELRRVFGWPPPFHDPGVGQFGLTNAVFAVGDTFVEVVAPARPGTTAGRYLERRGGDGGYMAIFQVRDLAAARRRDRGEPFGKQAFAAASQQMQGMEIDGASEIVELTSQRTPTPRS